MVVSSGTTRGGSGGALSRFARVIVHPEVADALRDGRGVVALESTLIAHGLPAPDNLRVAREAEAAVRAAGAAPATIAVVAGGPPPRGGGPPPAAARPRPRGGRGGAGGPPAPRAPPPPPAPRRR